MNAIYTIAKNTFYEIIRDRILYGLLVFAVFLILMSIALGNLSYTEQGRIAADFGFAGIHMSVSILAIFVGSTLVARELEKNTILTLLARPLTRTQFLLGKFFGLFLVIITVSFGLAAILYWLFRALGIYVPLSFFTAIYGVLAEAAVLLSIALFFGCLARPIMTVIFSASVFLLGHWISSLDYFIQKSNSELFIGFSKFLKIIVPNLEAFNWRSAPIYGDKVQFSEVANASGYALVWALFLIAATALVFRRRDFV